MFKSIIYRYRLIGLLVVGVILAAPAHSTELEEMPSGAYTLDLTHASVLWKVSHLGFSSYPGRFTDFTVDLSLDSADISKSEVAVDIKVDSIQTAYPYPEEEDFDAKLSKDWFKSGEFPSITFKSKNVSPLQGKRFTIAGDMTMMGKTEPVVLNATLNKAVTQHPFKKVPAIGFSATTTIDRTVWGLSKYAPNIGAVVEVSIEGEFLFEE